MKTNKFTHGKIFLILLIIAFGVYLSFIGGYGSDEDTMPMIGVFQSILYSGKLMSSRFTGYPVAEIGLGFLSHYFGSFAANLCTFIFLILAILFFYLGLAKTFNINNFLNFFILCLTSPILFFDNIEPIDYSWALFFFSLGIYLFKKNYLDFSSLVFGVCVGTRISFILFIAAFLFFHKNDKRIIISNRLTVFICSFIIGGLFYLPICYQFGFGFEWLSSARPIDQGMEGLFYRFIYKTIQSLGIPFFIGCAVLFFFRFKDFSRYIKFYPEILFIILSNLLLFLYIPAELSYLQPLLISLYFFISIFLSEKIVFFFIIANVVLWFVNFDYLKVKYRSDDICNKVEAVTASINFHFTNGALLNYLNTRDKIRCWIKDDERGKKILKGSPLK
jgi:hypothetical protein